MKKFIAAFILSISLFTVQAQDMNNKRAIEVTGVNETEITPDQITLLITLSETKEAGPIQKQEEELKKIVKDLGIDAANLTLNSADADYEKIHAFKKDVVITKSYQLKITNAEMVGKVYERLDKMSANDASILSIDHSKMTEYKKESRIKAIKAAKEKVDYLLEAIGEKAGQPIQINEIESYAPVYANMRYMAKEASGSDSGGDISFKKIKLKSTISVRYEIVNK